MEETNTTLPSKDLANTARLHAMRFHHRSHDARLLFHNFGQTEAILNSTKQLIGVTQASEVVEEVALIAAAFYNTGFTINYLHPTDGAVEIANEFLSPLQYDKTELVLQVIQQIHRQAAKTPAAALLLDAINIAILGEKFNDNIALWRVEQELVLGKPIPKSVWHKQMMDQLLSVKFYTPHGKIHYAPILAQNIIKQKSRLDKLEDNPATSNPIERNLYDLIENTTTQRGVQTLFRTNFRNHIHLSAIADNKANIMISVNAILISVLITVLTWRNITETNPKIILPSVIFLITALSSLIFAVLSARPKITKLNQEQSKPEIIKKNILFFGNFVGLPLSKYEAMIDELLHDEALLYGNMSRDLYHLGKVLAQKYFYLTISYNIFMFGFILSVVLFLAFLFI